MLANILVFKTKLTPRKPLARYKQIMRMDKENEPDDINDQAISPVVLLATDNVDLALPITDSLKQCGYQSKICLYDGQTLKNAPKETPRAILCVFSDYVERAPAIIGSLKKHFAPRDIPIVGVLTRPGDVNLDVFDSVIFAPAHPSQIANRVNSMIRLQRMEQEIVRRTETLAEDFGIDYTLTEDALNQPFRILFIGKASPEFMVVINALQSKNVEVVAAFTSFSAFDFLHERTFDAVVMNALDNTEPAMTISETMRRNSRLYHVPTLFLVNADTFDKQEQAFKSGARDIIAATADETEICGRILELANYHRIHDQLKREFGSLGGETCLDQETGVFNEEFFCNHFRRVGQNLKKTEEPVSLMVMRVTPTAHFEVAPKKIKQAMVKIGTMIKSLVRMEDITARLEEDVFAIAFPGQNRESIENVADRIREIIDCSAFESGSPEDGPLTVAIDIIMNEMLPHENSDMMIGHAMAELIGEPVYVERSA